MSTVLLSSLLSSIVLLAPQDPDKTLYLRMNNGQVVSGQLVALDGDMVRLKVHVLGGSMDIERNLSEFQPASAYRVRMAANPPSSFESHFKMAQQAADSGLLTQAGNEARAALKTVQGTPDFAAKRTEVRTWAAKALQKMIADDVAKGDLESARHCQHLLTTRFASELSQEQLDTVSQSVEGLANGQKQKRMDAQQQRMDQQTQQRINSRLAPIQKEVAQGDQFYAQAIRVSNQTVQSRQLCERAIDTYRNAWQRLQALVKQYPDDKHLASVAATMGHHMHDQAIRAGLHAASVLTTQTDYKDAMKWVDKVLAYDPGNEQAKQMIRTIQMAEAASSDDWGWNWSRPGGPGRRMQERRNR